MWRYCVGTCLSFMLAPSQKANDSCYFRWPHNLNSLRAISLDTPNGLWKTCMSTVYAELWGESLNPIFYLYLGGIIIISLYKTTTDPITFPVHRLSNTNSKSQLEAPIPDRYHMFRLGNSPIDFPTLEFVFSCFSKRSLTFSFTLLDFGEAVREWQWDDDFLCVLRCNRDLFAVAYAVINIIDKGTDKYSSLGIVKYALTTAFFSNEIRERHF